MKSSLILALLCLPLQGLVIKVDYRFDSEGFFDNPSARAVIEAAAARWSRVVNQELLPVNLQDEVFSDARFELNHPGTGEDRVFSVAASRDSDFYVQVGQRAADEYLGGFCLDEDEWILFVGARNLDALARGGPIGGAGNLRLFYEDPASFLNRGFNVGVNSLPVIGGVISFDLDRNWNFNLSNPNAEDLVDFYSVALHEIGHGLGLNSRSTAEWRGLLNGNFFTGQNALAAYEADSGIALQGLRIADVSDRDYHWASNTYKSKIFPFGVPLYFGTVGLNGSQSLLMEPGFDLAGPSRLEITNVDLAGLRDLGWSIISENPAPGPELPVSLGRTSSGDLTVELMTETGSTYTVQTSPDGFSWVNVIPSITGDGSMVIWEDGLEGFCDPYGPASALPGKYYRVIKN